VHEQALMRDVIAKVEDTARAAGAGRVTSVRVRFGPLSHFTPAHFREHFRDAARGTLAAAAAVDVVDDGSLGDGVLVESIEVER
jgi:hydrogenase nickel incorporation protein HypA/HybF